MAKIIRNKKVGSVSKESFFVDFYHKHKIFTGVFLLALFLLGMLYFNLRNNGVLGENVNVKASQVSIGLGEFSLNTCSNKSDVYGFGNRLLGTGEKDFGCFFSDGTKAPYVESVEECRMVVCGN